MRIKNINSNDFLNDPLNNSINDNLDSSETVNELSELDSVFKNWQQEEINYQNTKIVKTQYTIVEQIFAVLYFATLHYYFEKYKDSIKTKDDEHKVIIMHFYVFCFFLSTYQYLANPQNNFLQN